jgi:hypothetical protein
MNRAAGLMLALIVSGCTGQNSQPQYIYSRDTTLVVMHPLSITEDSKDSRVRFRDVDGRCQYSGKLGTDGHGVWWADIDTEFCYPDSNNPGVRPFHAIISMGLLKEGVEQNTQINVRFSTL